MFQRPEKKNQERKTTDAARTRTWLNLDDVGAIFNLSCWFYLNTLGLKFEHGGTTAVALAEITVRAAAKFTAPRPRAHRPLRHRQRDARCGRRLPSGHGFYIYSRQKIRSKIEAATWVPSAPAPPASASMWGQSDVAGLEPPRAPPSDAFAGARLACPRRNTGQRGARAREGHVGGWELHDARTGAVLGVSIRAGEHRAVRERIGRGRDGMDSTRQSCSVIALRWGRGGGGGRTPTVACAALPGRTGSHRIVMCWDFWSSEAAI